METPSSFLIPFKGNVPVPCNIHKVLLCFCCGYIISSNWIGVFFRFLSLVSGQSWYCPCSSYVILKNVFIIDQYQTTNKLNNTQILTSLSKKIKHPKKYAQAPYVKWTTHGYLPTGTTLWCEYLWYTIENYSCFHSPIKVSAHYQGNLISFKQCVIWHH